MRRAGSMLRKDARGQTLIEVVASVGIFAVLAGGIFTMMRESQRVYGTIVRSVQSRQRCSAGLVDLGHDLEQASNAVLTVDATAADGDLLRFQTPLGVAAGVVTWGARFGSDTQHVDYPAAFLEYLVTIDPRRHPQRTLVRRIVDVNGNALAADTIIVDGIDSPDPSLGKGFKVARNQRQVTLTVRTRNSHDSNETDRGKDLVKSQQVTIRLRNP